MKMFFNVVKIVESESDPEQRILELDYEYCLPKWFWTQKEWFDYQLERRACVEKIQVELRDTEV